MDERRAFWWCWFPEAVVGASLQAGRIEVASLCGAWRFRPCAALAFLRGSSVFSTGQDPAAFSAGREPPDNNISSSSCHHPHSLHLSDLKPLHSLPAANMIIFKVRYMRPLCSSETLVSSHGPQQKQRPPSATRRMQCRQQVLHSLPAHTTVQTAELL